MATHAVTPAGNCNVHRTENVDVRSEVLKCEEVLYLCAYMRVQYVCTCTCAPRHMRMHMTKNDICMRTQVSQFVLEARQRML